MNSTEKITLFIIGLILTVAFTWSVVANYFWGRPPMTKDLMATKAVLVDVKRGMLAYDQVYGHFPSGPNSTVMKILAGSNIEGQNPKQLTFLQFADKKRYNDRFEVVDWWGSPIIFKGSGDSNLVIYSLGKNRIDDGGRRDDMQFVISRP